MSGHEIKTASEPSTLNLKQKRSAFTLVELIVVITILAILGTIWFLSVGGYSSRARDSDRLTDVANLSKSLDLSIVTAGSYPTPDNSFSVVYSGGVVWYQGTVSNGVIQQLHASISGGGISKKPVDPLDGTEYMYSTLAFGKAYQVAVDYENDLGQSALNWSIPSAYAAPGAPSIAYVRGNYGGLVAKTTTGSVIYVIALPSILTNSGVTAGSSVELKSNTLSGTLLFNGKALKSASSYNPVSLVYSGAALPKNDSTGQITAMANAIRAAYSGTDIASNSAIATLLSTSSGSLGTLGSSILEAQLWAGNSGNEGNNGNVSGTCTGLPTNMAYYNGTTSYAISNAPQGTSLNAVTAGYSATPAANTCQYSCSWLMIDGSTCLARIVTSTSTNFSDLLTPWNNAPNGTVFYFKHGTVVWGLTKAGAAPDLNQWYVTNWFNLTTRYSSNGGVSFSNLAMYDYNGTSYGGGGATFRTGGWYITYGWACSTNPPRMMGNGMLCDSAGNNLGTNWEVYKQ